MARKHVDRFARFLFPLSLRMFCFQWPVCLCQTVKPTLLQYTHTVDYTEIFKSPKTCKRQDTALSQQDQKHNWDAAPSLCRVDQMMWRDNPLSSLHPSIQLDWKWEGKCFLYSTIYNELRGIHGMDSMLYSISIKTIALQLTVIA